MAQLVDQPTAVAARLDSSGRRALTVESRRWLLLSVMVLALLVVVLDNTVLNVALPAFNGSWAPRSRNRNGSSTPTPSCSPPCSCPTAFSLTGSDDGGCCSPAWPCWESQFVSMHSDDMLFTQPFFFHLFSPANFTADLAIHVAVIPVILFALIMGHLTLVRLQGIARPL